MKKLIYALLVGLTIIMGATTAEAKTVARKSAATSISGKPLTQYAIVDASKGMADFRSFANMAKILRGLGFQVNYTRNRFNASRNGTTVRIDNDEDGSDLFCYINFRNQAEANEFVNSMKKSGWEKNDRFYFHPMSTGCGVLAKVSGTQVILVSYWEGAPVHLL